MSEIEGFKESRGGHTANSVLNQCPVYGMRYEVKGARRKAQGAGFYQEKLEYCKLTLLTDSKGSSIQGLTDRVNKAISRS